MRLQIIDIGNSKGIRIPQTILKQAVLGDEVDLEVTEGKIVLKKAIDRNIIPNFNSIKDLDDHSIQQLLRKITGVDLLTALVGAQEGIKEAIYRNVSERVKQYLVPTVERLENGDAKDLLIERSRNALCEALLDTLSQR